MDYHRLMVEALAPSSSKRAKSSGIWNPRTKSFYTKKYALEKRSKRSRDFVRHLAEAHDRAEARGAAVPVERFTGGGYKPGKAPKGWGWIGTARVVCRIWGRATNGTEIVGRVFDLIVNISSTIDATPDNLRRKVEAEIYAFRFKRFDEGLYLEEIDDLVIFNVRPVLHLKPAPTLWEKKSEKIPF